MDNITKTNIERPVEVSIKNSQMVRATIASLIGWALDLYDLFLLLYVATTIGNLFFPASNQTLSLAAVYASFAVTLLMRPLGSAIFGVYADKNGRKKAMTVAIIGAGLSTAAFGLLPTIHQVGVAASIAFLILRLVQGIFVGGVVASTHTIGTESASPKYRGLMSGLIGGGGAGLGALFASIAYSIVSAIFPGDAFDTLGWRIMFFTGIIGALFGLFIFRSLDESPLWKQLKEKQSKDKMVEQQKSPFKMFLTKYYKVLFVNLMIVIGGGSGYYLTAGFIPTFLKVVNKVPAAVSSGVLIATSITTILAAIVVGHLSELIGRKKTFMIIGILCVFGLPYFYLSLAHSTTTTSIYLNAIGLVFLGNASYAPVLIFLNERFPTEVRSTGTGLSWNVGFAIGGMMPTFVNLASGTVEHIPYTLMYFTIVIYLVYILGSFIIPETKGNLK